MSSSTTQTLQCSGFVSAPLLAPLRAKLRSLTSIEALALRTEEADFVLSRGGRPTRLRVSSVSLGDPMPRSRGVSSDEAGPLETVSIYYAGQTNQLGSGIRLLSVSRVAVGGEGSQEDGGAPADFSAACAFVRAMGYKMESQHARRGFRYAVSFTRSSCSSAVTTRLGGLRESMGRKRRARLLPSSTSASHIRHLLSQLGGGSTVVDVFEILKDHASGALVSIADCDEEKQLLRAALRERDGLAAAMRAAGVGAGAGGGAGGGGGRGGGPGAGAAGAAGALPLPVQAGGVAIRQPWAVELSRAAPERTRRDMEAAMRRLVFDLQPEFVGFKVSSENRSEFVGGCNGRPKN